MSDLRWEHRPSLRSPTLVAAFEGWNDAGESASTAVRFLAKQLRARRFATIDPEDFYDFTVARPHVRLDEESERRVIDWPTPTFEAVAGGAGAGAGRDLVFLHAIEPSLRWRTFTENVVELCQALEVQTVFTLGALLADVPHTRPVRVTGSGTDPVMIEALDLARSRYEGPTGIVGVLHDGLATAGLRSASFWATTPHYLSQTPSPKAALALVRRMASVLDVRVETTELEIATAAYERQVDEMLSGEDDVVDYVRRLEEDAEGDEPGHDTGLDETIEMATETPDVEALTEDIERFLRDQHGRGA